MISQTEENYLKAIYTLTSLKGEASVNDISKQLDIKMPTVNSMMKRLAEKSWWFTKATNRLNSLLLARNRRHLLSVSTD